MVGKAERHVLGADVDEGGARRDLLGGLIFILGLIKQAQAQARPASDPDVLLVTSVKVRGASRSLRCGVDCVGNHRGQVIMSEVATQAPAYGTQSIVTGVAWLGPPPPGCGVPPVPFKAKDSGVASVMVSPARWTSSSVSR